MIDLSPQPATWPADAVHGVLAQVFDRVQDGVDASATPPDLDAAIARMRRHQRADQPEHFARALHDIAHAAIAQLVRHTAVIDPRVAGR